MDTQRSEELSKKDIIVIFQKFFSDAELENVKQLVSFLWMKKNIEKQRICFILAHETAVLLKSQKVSHFSKL
jgi:hypothetical protein